MVIVDLFLTIILENIKQKKIKLKNLNPTNNEKIIRFIITMFDYFYLLWSICRNRRVFSKTYERLRGWKSVDGDWIYDNGSTREWKFIFNVDFYSSEEGDDMFGTVMVNDIGVDISVITLVK